MPRKMVHTNMTVWASPENMSILNFKSHPGAWLAIRRQKRNSQEICAKDQHSKALQCGSINTSINTTWGAGGRSSTQSSQLRNLHHSLAGLFGHSVSRHLKASVLLMYWRKLGSCQFPAGFCWEKHSRNKDNTWGHLGDAAYQS